MSKTSPSPETASDWVVTTIRTLGILHCGQSPSAANVNANGEGTPYVSGPEQWDGFKLHLGKWTTAPGRMAPQNSIFITVKGAGVGKLFPGTAAAIGRDIYAFEPSAAVDFQFVFRALQYSIQDVVSKARGDIPGLSKAHILDHEISLPPLHTQKAVASKIDQLFSEIDEGERALKRVQQLVERYRQSVLKAAVTGELTRDWREKHQGQLESGEALLQRILQARREAWERAELEKMTAKGGTPTNDKWKLKYQEPVWPDTEGLPKLPKGWIWAALGQICFVETGATPKRGVDRYYKDGTIDWITSSSVNDRVITSASEKITEAALAETNAKVFPEGSLIVAMYGEGKTRGKVSELGIAAASNQACAALLIGHIDGAVKTYLRINLEYCYEALRAEAAGGVQPNLNLSIVRGIALPIPSLREIKAINERVASLETESSAIVDGLSSWRRRSNALRQSVLKQAFSGSLRAID